jgi:hypothetical protein
MSDLANENGAEDVGFIWRLRHSKDHDLVGLDGSIVFELTGNHGIIFASVSIPSETVEALLRPHLSIFAELQLDGSLSLDSEFFALFPPSQTTDIYELVKEGIAPEMLADELDAKERLGMLRQRLSDALALVAQTLANLDKPNG